MLRVNVHLDTLVAIPARLNVAPRFELLILWYRNDRFNHSLERVTYHIHPMWVKPARRATHDSIKRCVATIHYSTASPPPPPPSTSDRLSASISQQTLSFLSFGARGETWWNSRRWRKVKSRGMQYSWPHGTGSSHVSCFLFLFCPWAFFPGRMAESSYPLSLML